MEFCASSLVFLLTVLRFSVSSPVKEQCEDTVHLSCGSKEFHDSLNEESFSLLKEETLSAHCSEIIEDIQCKKDFLSNCDPVGAEDFALATDGIKDVLTDLCNETTDIRKEFHRHSPCISNISDDYQDCILNTANSASYDYDSEGNDITSKDAIVERMCRFYDPFKFCSTDVTRRYCGNSAAQLVEQIIVRLAAPAINAKCSPKN